MRLKYKAQVHETWTEQTCDQLSDIHIAGLSEQPQQCWDSITVLDGHLVEVIFAEGNIPQGTTGFSVDLRLGVIQQPYQYWNATELPDILLDLVVLITEMLQIGRSVGLDRIHGVAEHGDDLAQVGVSPSRVFANGVQADHAGTLM